VGRPATFTEESEELPPRKAGGGSEASLVECRSRRGQCGRVQIGGGGVVPANAQHQLRKKGDVRAVPMKMVNLRRAI